MLADSKRVGDAIVSLDNYLQEHPDSLEASVLLAKLYGQTGKIDVALAIIDRLKKSVNKNDVSAIHDIATTELLLGRIDQDMVKLLSKKSGGEVFTAALVNAHLGSDLDTAELYAEKILESDMVIDNGLPLQEIESVELLKSKEIK